MDDLIDNYSFLEECKFLKHGKKSITRQEVESFAKTNPDIMAADASVYISIRRYGLETHEGEKSFEVYSFDGFTNKEIPPSEMYQIVFFLIFLVYLILIHMH